MLEKQCKDKNGKPKGEALGNEFCIYIYFFSYCLLMLSLEVFVHAKNYS